MTYFHLYCFAAVSILFRSFGSAQEERMPVRIQETVMSADFEGKPFPGGLQFSDDGSRIWTNELEAWSVRDGQQVDTSQFKSFKRSRQIVDRFPDEKLMLIAIREKGELLFWDRSEGLRRRALNQKGKLVAARLIDQGKRFALVFSQPPSIYYGNVEPDGKDEIVALKSKVYKCAVSPDGKLLAVQNDRDIEIWDVKQGDIRTTFKHDNKLFSFTLSPDGRWLATGTANDNMVRLYDLAQGVLQAELKMHTEGTIFLTSAVYSLAFSPDGELLASGGHDGRVIVWNLETLRPVLQTQIDGPPIVCGVAFSSDSKLLSGSFENAGAKRGIRVWDISGVSD